ncbi:MAG: hypothetical protein ABSB59_18220 [Streptosporangiaceae bacterium]|jgi:hypothetical protein
MADSAAVQSVLAELGIDAPDLRVLGNLHLFRAEAEQLLPWWRQLRAAHERTGRWPVLLGTDEDVVNLGNRFGRDPDAEVARGLELDPLARLAAWRDDLHADDPDAPPRGVAEGLRPQDEGDFDLAGKPGWIGLVTAAAGYLVPGLLAWSGAENAGLEPADQAHHTHHRHHTHRDPGTHGRKAAPMPHRPGCRRPETGPCATPEAHVTPGTPGAAARAPSGEKPTSCDREDWEG